MQVLSASRNDDSEGSNGPVSRSLQTTKLPELSFCNMIVMMWGFLEYIHIFELVDSNANHMFAEPAPPLFPACFRCKEPKVCGITPCIVSTYARSLFGDGAWCGLVLLGVANFIKLTSRQSTARMLDGCLPLTKPINDTPRSNKPLE